VFSFLRLDRCFSYVNTKSYAYCILPTFKIADLRLKIAGIGIEYKVWSANRLLSRMGKVGALRATGRIFDLTFDILGSAATAISL